MTTTIIETRPTHLHTGDDNGWRCTLCDRAWPGEPEPIEHKFVMVLGPPRDLVCHCDADHAAPVWHGFVACNRRGPVLAGMVCPVCAVDPGLADAVITAVNKVANAYRRTNNDRAAS